MTDFRGAKIGVLDKNFIPIRCGDTVEIECKSYGTYQAPVEFIQAKAQFGAVTYSGKAVQIEMPKRAWDREHKPSERDGAMYAAEAIFRYSRENPKGFHLPKYLPDVRVVKHCISHSTGEKT